MTNENKNALVLSNATPAELNTAQQDVHATMSDLRNEDESLKRQFEENEAHFEAYRQKLGEGQKPDPASFEAYQAAQQTVVDRRQAIRNEFNGLNTDYNTILDELKKRAQDDSGNKPPQKNSGNLPPLPPAPPASSTPPSSGDPDDTKGGSDMDPNKNADQNKKNLPSWLWPTLGGAAVLLLAFVLWRAFSPGMTNNVATNGTQPGIIAAMDTGSLGATDTTGTAKATSNGGTGIFVSGNAGGVSGGSAGSTSSDMANNGSWWKRIWNKDGTQEAVLAPGYRTADPVNGDGSLASISSEYIPQMDINGHYEAGLLIGERIVDKSFVPAGSIVTGVIGETLNANGVTVSKVGSFYFPDGGYIYGMGSYVLREKERLAPTSLFVTDPEGSTLKLESKWTEYTNASAVHGFWKCSKDAQGNLPVVDASAYNK